MAIKALQTFILSFLVLSSCKARPPSNQAPLKAKIFADEELAKTLIPHLHRKSLNFCASALIDENHKRNAIEAYLSWANALHSVATQEIATGIKFLPPTDPICVSEERTLTIQTLDEAGAGGRQHYSREDKAIRISPKDKFSVYLHEFGHAFGLLDTYDDSIKGSCQVGQPYSVMCGKFSNLPYFRDIDLRVLLADDIWGARAAYCRYYRNASAGCKTLPEIAPRKNLKSDGSSRFTLDAEFAENTSNCADPKAVQVKSVKSGSMLEIAGFKTGLCVAAINLIKTPSVATLNSALQGAFMSSLSVETYRPKGLTSIDEPEFINATDTSTSKQEIRLNSLVFAPKGLSLRAKDGRFVTVGANSPCQVLDLSSGTNEVRIACHFVPGWVSTTKVEPIVLVE